MPLADRVHDELYVSRRFHDIGSPRPRQSHMAFEEAVATGLAFGVAGWSATGARAEDHRRNRATTASPPTRNPIPW
jgi:hypothetical protein